MISQMHARWMHRVHRAKHTAHFPVILYTICHISPVRTEGNSQLSAQTQNGGQLSTNGEHDDAAANSQLLLPTAVCCLSETIYHLSTQVQLSRTSCCQWPASNHPCRTHRGSDCFFKTNVWQDKYTQYKSLAVCASPNSPNRSPSPKTLALRTKCALPSCEFDTITLMS